MTSLLEHSRSISSLFRRNNLACGVASVLALASWNLQAEEVKDDAEAEEVEELVVTGSRLRNARPTSPLTVITMEDIKNQGINSVEGIIRSLPQNYASQTPTSAVDNSGSVGSLGVATANLRGMGSEATLILVNGRRTAGTPTFSGSVVNLNTIPFSAIERVEVLTDGASAVYGSDAVAGVINFILRKGYDAEEVTTVRYEDSGNGGNSFSLEQSFGTSWDSGALTGNLRYQETDPISGSKAGFTTRDLRQWGGGDGRTTSYGAPGVLKMEEPCCWWISTPLGAVDPNRDGSVPVMDLSEFDFDNIVPWDDTPKNLSDARESFSAFLNVEQELMDGVTAYAEMTFAKNSSVAETRTPLTTVVVPTSNAFNGTGEDLLMGYAFAGEVEAGLLPRHSNETESENLGFALGFNAELPFKNWQMDGYINYSTEESYTRSFDGFIDEALEAALADSDPATALNLFGDGSLQNPATLAAIFGADTHEWSRPNTQTNETSQISLTANGDLFELPAGAVAMVLGVDQRNESKDMKGYIASTLSTSQPERDVLSVMSELNIPLIGENNSLPGIHSFDVRMAARWEEYSIDGPFNAASPTDNVPNTEKTFTHTSPTIGFSWYVTPELKLRANKGESFTAPRLSSLFGAPVEPYFVYWIADSLAADGITNDPVTGTPIVERPFQPTGNADLKPEVSETLSYGVDWTPSGALEGLSVSATYSEIDTTDVIGSSMSLIWNDPAMYLATSVHRDETGEIDLFQTKPVNFSQEGVEAIDLNVTYDFENDWGMFQYGFAGSHTANRLFQFLPTSPENDTSGTLGGPDKEKFRTWLNWNRESYGAQINMNYSSSYTARRETSYGPDQAVEHYITFDLTGHYEMDNGFRFNGGVRNLTNTSFPFVDNRTPFDPRRVDINGRVIYMEVAKSFDLL